MDPPLIGLLDQFVARYDDAAATNQCTGFQHISEHLSVCMASGPTR